MPTSAQATAVKELEKEQAAQADETPETIEVSVSGGKTVTVTQDTVPTGIFPLPARLLHWAGLK
jgi:hypothetical protein